MWKLSAARLGSRHSFDTLPRKYWTLAIWTYSHNEENRVGKQKSRKGRSTLHHEPPYDAQHNTIRAPKLRKYEQGALDKRVECRVFLEEVMAHGQGADYSVQGTSKLCNPKVSFSVADAGDGTLTEGTSVLLDSIFL